MKKNLRNCNWRKQERANFGKRAHEDREEVIP
jgi:hypothetical protein